MSITDFGYDVFTCISLYLYSYDDIIALKHVNKSNYKYLFKNEEIELHSQMLNIDLCNLKKMNIYEMVIYDLPNTDIIRLYNCNITELFKAINSYALHIQDSYSLYTSLSFKRYDNLKALFLYNINFSIDPDELTIPNLEYLYMYESGPNEEYILIFNVERFPKLKYLDISCVYVDRDDAHIQELEYYNGYPQQYNMPNLLYLELPNNYKMLLEEQYLTSYPKLTTIITSIQPVTSFDTIKIINPNISSIARQYYNIYFNRY